MHACTGHSIIQLVLVNRLQIIIYSCVFIKKTYLQEPNNLSWLTLFTEIPSMCFGMGLLLSLLVCNGQEMWMRLHVSLSVCEVKDPLACDGGGV